MKNDSAICITFFVFFMLLEILDLQIGEVIHIDVFLCDDESHKIKCRVTKDRYCLHLNFLGNVSSGK
jgi:hypothetical protein